MLVNRSPIYLTRFLSAWRVYAKTVFIVQVARERSSRFDTVAISQRFVYIATVYVFIDQNWMDTNKWQHCW